MHFDGLNFSGSEIVSIQQQADTLGINGSKTAKAEVSFKNFSLSLSLFFFFFWKTPVKSFLKTFQTKVFYHMRGKLPAYKIICHHVTAKFLTHPPSFFQPHEGKGRNYSEEENIPKQAG